MRTVILALVVLSVWSGSAMAQTNPNKFWKVSDYSRKNHLPASQDDIREAEGRLHVSLPVGLRSLYGIQNGGRVRASFFASGKTEDARRPFLDGNLLKLSAMDTMKELASTIDFPSDDEDWSKTLQNSEKLVVISRHGTDAMLCLDFRSSANAPSVVLFNTAGRARELLRVPHFDEFLAGLKDGETE